MVNESAERDYKRYYERYARDYHCTVEEARKTAMCVAYKGCLEECERAGISERKGI